MKDLGQLKYLGIEASRRRRKYFHPKGSISLTFLRKLKGRQPSLVLLQLIPIYNQLTKDGDPFNILERYKRLVMKLNYLTFTLLDIDFVVSGVSQFFIKEDSVED